MATNYKQKLRDAGLLGKAEKWLKKNPRPKSWNGSKYSYAYTEMGTFSLGRLLSLGAIISVVFLIFGRKR